ncbi:Abscisic acid 8'-hydroxylase 4 [Bienertia sinuspersici]
MPYNGRKGVPTFNVLVSSDIDMCFTFVSAGWQGSAYDTRLAKYHLVDKGYPNYSAFPVPYPKLSYHKSQF